MCPGACDIGFRLLCCCCASYCKRKLKVCRRRGGGSIGHVWEGPAIAYMAMSTLSKAAYLVFSVQYWSKYGPEDYMELTRVYAYPFLQVFISRVVLIGVSFA